MFTKYTLRDNCRLLSHFLFKSENLFIGIDHFLVVFPSILLMAKILNENNFNNNSISLLLLGTGICNLIFYIITKSKIPIFIAPSFTFIGFTTTTMLLSKNDILIGQFNVFIGYFFAGIIFVIISLLYKSFTIRKYVKLTLPDALVGPLISLIGLDLLNTAIKDAGFQKNDAKSIFIAIFTLCVIILATVLKRKHLRNASILIGVICGMVTAYFLGEFKFNINSEIISFPKLNFTVKNLNLCNTLKKIELTDIIIAIIPATVVVISENIAKITLLEKIMRSDENTNKNDFSKFYESSIFGHAISFLLSVVLGAVPNAIYAENIALMEIKNIEGYNKNKILDEGNNIVKYYKRISTYPLKIAGVICIIFSLLTILQDVLVAIPMPVYGGMELFVFSIIAAQGVQLLVDRKVDYKKVTNQIITSVTLLTGLSGVSINLNVTEISGLSLALLVGITLNLIFKICSFFGLINEKIKVINVIDVCISSIPKHGKFIIEAEKISSDDIYQYIKGENRTDKIIHLVENVSNANIIIDDLKHIQISEVNDGFIIVKVSPYEDEYKKIINDCPENILKMDDEKYLIIHVNENMSMYKLKKICHRICQ